MTSAFGPFITPNQVESAVIATLKKWNATYLREMERHEHKPVQAFPNIRSFRAADAMTERFNEQQIPACQVMISDEVDVITKATEIDGMFHGDIDILVIAPEPEAARELACIYAWALGMIIVQQPQLDKSIPISATAWDKMGVPAVGRPEGRWMALGSIRTTFLVENMCQPLGGPTEPIETEPGAFPTVETVHLTTTLEAVE